MPTLPSFEIDAEIGRAQTPPAWVYRDPAAFEVQRERLFARSWQLVPGAERAKSPGHVLPFTLLPGCLDVPLLLARGQDGVLRCLSNVCTHRGTLVVEGEGHLSTLRCRYHGRRFGLDGCMLSMPEFEGVEGFPSPADDLPRVALAEWGPFAFCALQPAFDFDGWMEPVRRRVGHLPLHEFIFDPSTSREYLIRANWALYCDNYLEEFHIPYIHGASLGDKLDYGAYRTEVFDYCNLQLGVGRSAADSFALPAGHPDEGTLVAAYYFWMFPNLMLNFYPWGLSINVVHPIAHDRTRVSFLSYVRDPSRRAEGAGGDLHRVEMEDEAVIEQVQRGVQSRLYDRGRYSPRREVGTHHFHRLLAEFMNGEGEGRRGR
jgi:choline monooxygenase